MYHKIKFYIISDKNKVSLSAEGIVKLDSAMVEMHKKPADEDERRTIQQNGATKTDVVKENSKYRIEMFQSDVL